MLKHVGVSLRTLNLSDKQVLHMCIGNHVEEMKVSEVASSGTGTIHGFIVGHVSPIKSSKKQPDSKYFEGLCT